MLQSLKRRDGTSLQQEMDELLDYLTNIVLHFDFGPSFVFKDRDVNDIIAQGFPISLTYGSLAFVVATLVGVGLGIAAVAGSIWVIWAATSWWINRVSMALHTPGR